MRLVTRSQLSATAWRRTFCDQNGGPGNHKPRLARRASPRPGHGVLLDDMRGYGVVNEPGGQKDADGYRDQLGNGTWATSPKTERIFFPLPNVPCDREPRRASPHPKATPAGGDTRTRPHRRKHRGTARRDAGSRAGGFPTEARSTFHLPGLRYTVVRCASVWRIRRSTGAAAAVLAGEVRPPSFCLPSSSPPFQELIVDWLLTWLR